MEMPGSARTVSAQTATSWPESFRHGETVSSLQIEAVDHGDLVVVCLSGALDIYTSPSFQRELEPHERPGGRPLVVDLSRVGFLDSSGLGALFSLGKRLERPGSRLGLVGPRRLEAILRVAGLASAFIVGEDLAGVRAALLEQAAVPRSAVPALPRARPAQGAQATRELSGEGWLG